MKRFGMLVLCLAAMAGLSLSTFAQDDEKPKAKANEEGSADEKKEDPAVIRDKVSYGLGLNQGKQFKQLGADINPEMIAKGIADVLKGEKPKYSDEEIEAAFTVFQEELKSTALRKKKELAENNLKEGQAYLEKNGKREGVTTTKTGVQYEVLKSGKGKSPKKGDTVTTHYHGTLIDGTVFDSSVVRKEPASFRVDQVIKGWTEVLQLMKVGDKWKVYIPAELAYGESPRPGGPIGPNAALIFEIELLEVEEATEKE